MSAMDPSNNFRTNYVGRMVGEKAECSRFQIEKHVLPDEADVDLEKLSQFAFKHFVPKIHRVPVWKLFHWKITEKISLEVSGNSPEVKKSIAEHRVQEAKVLLSSLCTMRMTSSPCICNWDGLDVNYQPVATDIVHMIDLGNMCASLPTDQQTVDDNFQARLEIAKQMSVLCESNWIDTYWLTKVFDELLSRIFTRDILVEIVDSLKSQYIETRVTAKERFNEDVWAHIPIDFWIRSGGAAIFDHEPLFRLWDKVCSSSDYGIINLLSTTIYRYVVESKPFLVKLQNDDFELCERKLSIKAQNIIIARSIDGMINSGRFCSRKYD